MAKEDNIDHSEDMPMDENSNVETHEKHSKAHKHAHHRAKETSESHKAKGSCNSITCNSTNLWMIAAIVFFVATVLFLVLWLTSGNGSAVVGDDEIKTEMKSFIDANLLQPGTTSTIDSVEDLGSVYKLVVNVNGQQITSYATKDGEIFFPSGLVLEEVENAPETPQAQQPAPSNVPKNDKPVVEVFVMSHCPYGTQIEKGILPVVGLLGDKAQIDIKFVNYAMHGQKEIDEQLNQYCIQQEYSDDFYTYLQCFLNDGNTARCIEELEFDQSVLDKCMSATDAEFGISEDYADRSTWRGSFPSFALHDAENVKYGVQGSPTLVINGVSVSSARDAQSLKTAICAAYTDAPEECDTALPTASPSPGFGFGTSGTDSAAAACVV